MPRPLADPRPAIAAAANDIAPLEPKGLLLLKSVESERLTVTALLLELESGLVCPSLVAAAAPSSAASPNFTSWTFSGMQTGRESSLSPSSWSSSSSSEMSSSSITKASSISTGDISSPSSYQKTTKKEKRKKVVSDTLTFL
uniref:Hect ubiquitin-protein ligase n=1 Tax=Rhizophora mucronata TaxID=61149 RepID=A0A2P2MVE7_RHIMU